MRPSMPTYALSAALFFTGCAAAAPPAAAPPTPESAPSALATSQAPPPAIAAPPAASLPRLAFSHDDYDAARARAREEGKAVFVDVWAPWCHTCLSMQSYVLSDPSLAPLADRAVFVAIDSDRPENAAFLERHAVSAWPTFFVVDPETDSVAGYWPGAASLRELRAFVDEALEVMDAGRNETGFATGPAADLVRAHGAFARRDLAAAIRGYRKAVVTGGPDFARRSEALLGWIRALYLGKDVSGCATVGAEHVGSVRGSAAPADFSYYALTCAGQLPDGALRKATTTAVMDRLEALTRDPPADASADDRADALAIFADARAATGDAKGAREANEKRLAVLEKAANEAPTPAVAATYDYARAGAYVALGRGPEAVTMLEARERQMPDAYEPPGRLADVLVQLGRHGEAKAAIDRAIARAYGPRLLRYKTTRADILAKLGDAKGELEAMRDVVAGYEALPKGMASPERLVTAKARLAKLVAAQKKTP